MPQVNLTTLNEQELRQRLNASRARGDASLAYEILREMAERREAPQPRRPWLKRRPAEPHLVDVDLGDPLERSDELPPLPPGWRPHMVEPVAEPEDQPVAASVFRPLEPDPVPEAPLALAPRESRRRKAPPPPTRPPRGRKTAAPRIVVAEPEPAPPPEEPPEPLVLRVPEPLPGFRLPADDQDWGLRLRTEEPWEPATPPPEPREVRPTHRLRIAAGFAVGAISGLALGWGAASMTQGPPPAAAPVADVQSQPVSAPAALQVSVAEATPAPEPLPDPAAAQPVEVAEAAPPPEAVEPVREPEVPAAEPPAPQPVEAAKAETVKASGPSGCAAEPTPADREICGDPGLQRLQRELRRAYNEALDAHEDRALLRQRQLAWREARNTVSDPNRLARLYEQRIQKLHAAAAEARAQR